MGKHKVGRRLLQGTFLTYIAVISTGKMLNLSWGESLHAICPLGAVESIVTYFQTGTFMKHTGESNWVMMIALILLLIIAGATFCGWICPFGTVQEIVGKIGTKLQLRNKIQISGKIDSFLKLTKYAVLAIVIYQSSKYFKLVFEGYDPYYTLFNLWSSDITKGAIVILIITMVLSLFVERAYCRYLCPLGAINGIFNKFSLIGIKRDKKSCIDCKLCDKSCPMDIEVSSTEKVTNLSCNRCLKCIDSCPINSKNSGETLKLTGANGSWIFTALVVLVFLIPIGLGTYAGKFQEIEEKRSYELVEDIRGSYTLDELAKHYNIDLEEFKKGFGLPNNYNSNLKVKDLSEKGITLSAIRNYISYAEAKVKEIPNITIPFGVDKEKSLRENIQTSKPGILKEIFPQSETVTTTGKVLDIRRKTMLNDVKNTVKDYSEFLNKFKIPTDELPNATLDELEKKYGVSYDEMKAYIIENSK